MAMNESLTLEQGVTWNDRQFPPLKLWSDAAKTTVLPLTGYMGRSMLRKKYSDVSPVATLAVVIDIPSATIRRSYTATLSRAVPAGNYFHDLEIFTAADADVIRVVQGVITVTAEATKQ